MPSPANPERQRSYHIEISAGPEGEGLFSEPVSQRGVSEDGGRAWVESEAEGPLRVGTDRAEGRDGKAVGGADRAARKRDPSVPSDKSGKKCRCSNTENAEPAGELRMRIPDPSIESNDRADGDQVRKLRQSVRGWVRKAGNNSGIIQAFRMAMAWKDALRIILLPKVVLEGVKEALLGGDPALGMRAVELLEHEACPAALDYRSDFKISMSPAQVRRIPKAASEAEKQTIKSI